MIDLHDRLTNAACTVKCKRCFQTYWFD